MRVLALLTMIVIVSSCQNLRHATNINASSVKGVKFDLELRKKLDKKIKVITEEEAKNCEFVKEHTTKDNVLEQGETVPLYYLKYHAYEIDANAVIVDKTKEVGNYGHVVEGRIFKCSEPASQES